MALAWPLGVKIFISRPKALKKLLFAPVLALVLLFCVSGYAIPPEAEITPEIESVMVEAAEDLLHEIANQANWSQPKKDYLEDRLARTLWAAGKDQWAVVFAFSERLSRRYPEMLPGLIAYNAIKFPVVIPMLYYWGYPEAAGLLAALPDTLAVPFVYASIRLPIDVISNKRRNGFWFHQIFQRRDERLGFSSTRFSFGSFYWSSYWRYQFYNMNIPIGLDDDGQPKYESVLVPIRRAGAVRLAEELLSASESQLGMEPAATVPHSLDEDFLIDLVKAHMGEDVFFRFYTQLTRRTSDARLRQVALLQLLLKYSENTELIKSILLDFRNQRTDPVSRMLATIELVRSEIRFLKRESRLSNREERREMRQDASGSYLSQAWNLGRRWVDDLLSQGAQGRIIRRLNQFEIEVVAADLKGDPEFSKAKLEEARAYLTAIYLDHLVTANSEMPACSIALQNTDWEE